MPPRGERGRQTPDAQQLLASLIRLASAADPSRGGGLSHVTLRELVQNQQQLHQLTTTFLHSGEETHSALEAAPQARAALLQLLSSSLRAVTSELSAYSCSSGAGSSDSSGFITRAAKDFHQGRGDAAGCGVGAVGSSGPMGRWGQTLQTSARAMATYLSSFLIRIKSLTPGLSSMLAAAVAAGMLPAIVRLVAAARQASQPSPLASEQAWLASTANCLLGASLLADRRSQEVCQQLLPALADSSLLEHWAKDAAGGGGQGRQPNTNCIEELIYLVQMVSHGWRPLKTQAEAAPHVSRILHGPCLQYFVAAHVVSQLHAADGGPLYGMPREALMPPLPATGQEWQQQGGQGQGRGQGRQQRGGRAKSRLAAEGLAAALYYWQCLDEFAAADRRALPSEPPPLGPRNLVTLCLRTARVALASLGQLDSCCPEGDSRRSGAGGGGGTGLRRQLDASPGLALAALERAAELVVHKQAGTTTIAGSSSSSNRTTTIATAASSNTDADSNSNSRSCSGGAVDGRGDGLWGQASPRFLRQWWPLAVATVRCAMRHPGECASLPTCYNYSALLELSSFRDVDSHGLCFRPPPPCLRHALAAGYIPCYEAQLRRTLRLARDPSVGTVNPSIPWCIVSRLPSLALLLARGDARQAASLAATLAKAVLVVAGEPGRGGGSGGGSAGGSMGAGAGGSAGCGTNGGGNGTGCGTRGNGSGLAAVRDRHVLVRAGSVLEDLLCSFDDAVLGVGAGAGVGAGRHGAGAGGAAGAGEAGGSQAGVVVGAEAGAGAGADTEGGQRRSSATQPRSALKGAASTAGRKQLTHLVRFAVCVQAAPSVHTPAGQ